VSFGGSPHVSNYIHSISTLCAVVVSIGEGAPQGTFPDCVYIMLFLTLGVHLMVVKCY
jgi:hypothetical protein